MAKFHLPFYFLLVISCRLLSANAKGLYLSKREASGKVSDFEKEAIKIIEAEAAKLSDGAFSFDPVLIQVADKLNSETKYRIPGEKHAGEDLYTREQDDTGKETVVLTTDEDHMEWKNKKRVYIVLKKNKEPVSKQKEYFASVAYLRDAGDKDKAPFKISGGSYEIEWDLWDEHFVPGGSTMTLNSIFCTSSIILPCLFSDLPIEDGKNGIVKAAKRYQPKKSNLNDEKITDLIKIVVDTGNADDSYDMYRDIDFQRVMEGRGIFGGSNDGGMFGGVTKGVGGMLCGIFGSCSKSPSVTTVHVEAPMMGAPMVAPMGAYSPYAMPGAGLAGYPPLAGPEAYGMAPQPGYGVQGFDPSLMGGQGYDPSLMGGQGYDPSLVGYGRRKREDETANMLDFPGWKTQYITPEKGIYLKKESLLYYGFGNCPPKQLTDADLENAKTGEQLVTYYLMILRSDCVEILRKQLLKLLELDVLRVKDKSLIINTEVKNATNPKFNLHETVLFQTACEMDAFTTTYMKLLHDKSTEKPTTPDGSAPTSRSVNFAVELVLDVIATSRETSRLHMIAKSRHAITGTRYAFSKLAQDQQNMQGCADCEEDLKMNHADRLTIMGLTQYLKYGLLDVDLHNKNPHTSFKTFYTKNKELIEKKVDLYS